MGDMELKPCPFCGGEAQVVRKPYETKFCVGCDDDTCLGFSGLGWLYDSEQEAAEAWNRRAERTCRDLNPPSCRDFECSECGESSEFTPGFMPNYCPHCGARVEEASDDADR